MTIKGAGIIETCVICYFPKISEDLEGFDIQTIYAKSGPDSGLFELASFIFSGPKGRPAYGVPPHHKFDSFGGKKSLPTFTFP